MIYIIMDRLKSRKVVTALENQAIFHHSIFLLKQLTKYTIISLTYMKRCVLAMQKIYLILLSVFIVFTLCGCQDTTASSKENNATSFEAGNGIPVLSITTNNSSENSLDFVTKPVAGFVAEQIASWTPNYQMPPAPYYEECKITVTDANGSITLSDIDAQVKVRGNWTTTYDKKPLRLKFAEKQNLLGLNDGAEMKNWVLTAEYKDTSMLRNKTALSIAREILGQDALYAADACFVEVEINGEYWGVYLLTEYQQINPNRVDITEADADYEGIDIGYFMEFDGYYTYEDALQSFDMDYADHAPLVPFDGTENSEKTITDLSNVPGITIKSDIYSQEQHDFIASYVNNVYRIMYAAAYEDKAYVFNSDYTGLLLASETLSPQEAVERVVDTNSLANMYILNELACDADIYWSSFFMDVDFGEGGNKKLTFEAPWDFDSAMGNKDRCADGTGFYAANIVWDVNNQYKTINPWLAVLMHEDWFQELISDKWTTAYDSGVFERAYTMITEDTERYSEAFARNYEKWNNLSDKSAFASELSTKSAQCQTHAEASEYLLEWLKSRVEFLNEYWHE